MNERPIILPLENDSTPWKTIEIARRNADIARRISLVIGIIGFVGIYLLAVAIAWGPL